jgi:guanylate kinase
MSETLRLKEGKKTKTCGGGGGLWKSSLGLGHPGLGAVGGSGPASRGLLFVLSAPSGAGKDTILARFLENASGVAKCVTATTRPPRPGERDGSDYHFWSAEEFERRERAGELLESATVHGYRYGTPARWVFEQLERGLDVILKIDVQGALAVRERCPDVVLIFVAPPSLVEMEARLRGRGSESEAEVQRRLQDARGELARAQEYNYLIINDILESAVEKLAAIVIAERCRVRRCTPAEASAC